MANYFNISLIPKTGVTTTAVESSYLFALDWFRYAQYSWILKTNIDATALYSKLLPFAQPGGKLVIMPVNLNLLMTWNSQMFINWIQKNRGLDAEK